MSLTITLDRDVYAGRPDHPDRDRRGRRAGPLLRDAGRGDRLGPRRRGRHCHLHAAPAGRAGRHHLHGRRRPRVDQVEDDGVTAVFTATA